MLSKYLKSILIIVIGLVILSCQDSSSSDELEDSEDSFTPMIIVGDSGEVFFSTDGGTTWESGSSGTTSNLRAVDCSGNIAVASSNSEIFYSDDFGATWTDTATAFGGIHSDIFYHNGIFVIPNTTENVYYSEDDGVTWLTAAVDAAVTNIPQGRKLTVHDGSRFVLLGGGSTQDLTCSDDNGQTWEVCGSNVLSVAAGNRLYLENDLFFSEGVFYDTSFNQFADASTSFTDNRDIRDFLHDGENYVAVDGGGFVYVGSDETTWSSRQISTSEALDGIAKSDDGNFYIISDSGNVYISANLNIISTLSLSENGLRHIAYCD